jgi:hypothetical protein
VKVDHSKEQALSERPGLARTRTATVRPLTRSRFGGDGDPGGNCAAFELEEECPKDSFEADRTLESSRSRLRTADSVEVKSASMR